MQIRWAKFTLAAFASGSIAMLASAALAADMPVKAAYSMPQYNWSGWYAGLNAGGGWNRSRWTDITGNIIAPNTESGSNGSGFVGGVHAGYNYQNGIWVAGAEADFDGSAIKSSFNSAAQCAGLPPGVCKTQQPWIATLRARIGLAQDRWLVYGTGGIAFSDLKHRTDFIAGPPVTWNHNSRTGWVVGAGIEYALTDAWNIGIEWKYYDFGTKTAFGAGASDLMRFDDTENSVMARISYRFGQ